MRYPLSITDGTRIAEIHDAIQPWVSRAIVSENPTLMGSTAADGVRIAQAQDKATLVGAFSSVPAILVALLVGWLCLRHLWKHQRDTGHKVGVWFGGWALAVGTFRATQELVMATYWSDLIPPVFAVWATVCVLAWALGYIAGRLWFVVRTPKLATTSSQSAALPDSATNASRAKVELRARESTPESEEAMWSAAAAEANNVELRRPGLWGKAFSEAGGSTDGAKAFYMGWRVQEMRTQETEPSEAAGLLADCPRCTRVIPANSTSCPRCLVSFTQQSHFRLMPRGRLPKS